MIMSCKHEPGLFQKTAEKARVLSQDLILKTERIYSSSKINLCLCLSCGIFVLLS